MAGTEDNFPGPDNPSKMRRSVENAEHVGQLRGGRPISLKTNYSFLGLFAPRAGQNFRDEQRRRRSQYDRGTRLAEIEDSYGMYHRDYPDESKSFHATGLFGESRGLCRQSYEGTPFQRGGA